MPRRSLIARRGWRSGCGAIRSHPAVCSIRGTRILEDAERWLREAKDLQELTKKAFPQEPRSLDEFKKLHDEAIANLKRNEG